ncbi:hypothetical protein WK98_22465 [Burkholderia ubonensis]|nr:hypothetical protein WK98_22465 [Burkholderia ubonensis]
MSAVWLSLSPPLSSSTSVSPCRPQYTRYPRADMDAQFDHAFADRPAIAEVAHLDLTQANANPRLGDLVAHGKQPFGKRLVAVIASIAKEFDDRRHCNL